MSAMKPTGDDAAGASRPEAERGRKERGGLAGNQRHPPHVTENSEDAPLQRENESPAEVEPLPANASGRQEVSVEEATQEIDPESAYDRRPSEDKDQPPSKQDP